MLRDPRRDDHTICTAVAPDFVFTVRTYGTRPPYGPAPRARRQPSGLTGKPAPFARPVTRAGTPPSGKTARQHETAGVSAQIRLRKPGNLQVSATRLPRTREREPSQVTSVPSVAELIHLGMDTSVSEIVVAVLRFGQEIPVVDRIPGDEESVRWLIGRFPDRRLLSACYEAGPGGYELHRLLASMGVVCDVVAPGSLISKGSSDRLHWVRDMDYDQGQIPGPHRQRSPRHGQPAHSLNLK